ncbi:MAG: 2,3-bisphosphoglycerate-independent phosphoglycerate mutase, partial [Fusobacteria bacterium]|nr:2,3-bisphosphoglycerate-independent phosphoglycerate mutase [Fusobacteriota bacterium]
MVKPVVLLILDGWGLNEEQENNAIKLANTPNYDEIIRTYPMTSLQTSGLAVGLPEGQMGNSEVGHLNIGSGRVVYQDLTRIDKAIEDGSLYENPVLVENMALAVGQGKAIHLIGLLSDGGVHSHIRHAKALIKMAKEKGCQKLYFHGLLDGRDVPPKSAKQYIDELENYMKEVSLGSIATIQGRYYAMDRDNRWDRVELGYQAMANGQGLNFSTSIEALEDSYQRDVVDEFVLPSVIGSYQGMADGDSIILFNFRGDRAREISQVFYKEDFQGFETRPLRINYVCMTEYDEN